MERGQLRAFYQRLSANPPRASKTERRSFHEAVGDFTQSQLYAELVSPGGPADTEKVSQAAHLSRATVYAQTSGRNPVTVEMLAAVGDAGNPEGLFRAIAGLVYSSARRWPDAARDFVHGLLPMLGLEAKPLPQALAAAPTLQEALSAVTESAMCCSESMALTYAKLHDGRLDEQEWAELDWQFKQEDKRRQAMRDTLRRMAEPTEAGQQPTPLRRVKP